MLQFILGRACSGKSHYTVGKAAEASLSKKTVIIVPEQFSFETERAVLSEENYNSDNISVVGFTKLYREVARISGFGRLPVMSDSERLVLSDMALKASKEQLGVLSKFSDSTDFSTKIAEVIRDFKYADVTAEELLTAAEDIGGASGAKLRDISVIMSVYEALISDKYIDSSDYLTRLYELLEDIEYFKNTDVYIDSFTGFTGQQYKIIKRILKQCDNLYVSLCTDNIYSDRKDIFANINEAARRIKSCAESEGIAVAESVLLSHNHYSNHTISSLEGLFAKSDKPLSDSDSGECVKIINCADPREEALAAVTLVRNLVNKKDYRFKDFIIVARNAEEYKNYIEAFSQKCEVPCFFDKKIPLTETLLYIYINSLLRIKSSFSTENILSWLKCSLHGYSFEDVCSLEEYIYIWNIKGADWSSEWAMNPSGFGSDEISDKGKKHLERLNTIREDICKKLDDFCGSMNKSVRDKAASIYGFLKSEQIDVKLSELCRRFEAEGDSFNASVLRQSWDAVNEILSSLTKILPFNTSFKDFYNVFEVSARAVGISNVPQTLDEVTFGAADRIRPSKPKVSIILGANQGIFPSTIQNSGILTAADRKNLSSIIEGFEDYEIRGAIEENYLVYSMLCCPIDRSYIFYSKNTSKGAVLEPSAFINNIKSNLSNVEEISFSPLKNELFLPVSRSEAALLLSEFYGNDFESVKESVSDSGEFEALIKSFDKKNFTDSFTLSRENSDSLFKGDIYISATKFDDFHACRLMYFIKNGLKIGKIKPAELNPAQRGTLVHHIFESLIKKYGKDFGKLDRREISIAVDECIDGYLSKISGADILLNPRFKFLLSKVAKLSKNVAYHIAEEFAQSDFEPKCCELGIGRDGDIPEMRFPIEGGDMVLTGKIDRVDTYKNVIRIVDYKTNSKTFDLPDILYGLNMQMLIYLYAVMKNDVKILENARAGGILYIPANKKAISGSLSMSGLILDDSEIVAAMDSDNSGKFIPMHGDKSDAFIDEETFSLIFDKIEQLTFEMGAAIRSGDFVPEPVDGVNSEACKYCDFAHICRKKECEHTKVKKMKNSEIKELLKGGDRVEV